MPLRLAGLALILAASPAIAAEAIGTAVSVETEITAGTEGAQKALATGDTLFADDRVATNQDGVGQIEFRDRTRLVIGPGSTLTLDRFVYDPKRGKTDILIGFGRGSFRFITGKGAHKGYEIATPNATIGVRGTAFDVYVGDNGDLAVAMINGTVHVCSRINLVCRTHSAIGRFLHMTREGVFSLRDKWEDIAARSVGFVVAMPFMVNDGFLRPGFRAGGAVVRRYADVAGTTAGTVGRAAGVVVGAPGQAVRAGAGAVQRVNPFRRTPTEQAAPGTQPALENRAPEDAATREATAAPIDLRPAGETAPPTDTTPADTQPPPP